MADPSIGAGLFSGLSEGLLGWAKSRNEAADAEAERQSAWADFVAKSRFQQDLSDAASDKALKRQEALYDYEQRAKAFADQYDNDPDLAPIVKRVLTNDPTVTAQDKAIYNAAREAFGHLSAGQALPDAVLANVGAVGMPVGTHAHILAVNQANKDVLDQKKRAAEALTSETELRRAQAEDIAERPWKLTVQEHGKDERARATQNKAAGVLMGQYDTAIANYKIKQAAAQKDYAAAKTDALKQAAVAKLDAYGKEIDRIKALKEQVKNTSLSQALVQAETSKSPGMQEIAATIGETLAAAPEPTQEEKSQAQREAASRKLPPGMEKKHGVVMPIPSEAVRNLEFEKETNAMAWPGPGGTIPPAGTVTNKPNPKDVPEEMPPSIDRAIDGQLYRTAKGLARWDASKKKFIGV